MARDPDFFEKVYEVVRQIPYGKVCTYGIIARCLGTGRSARTVGWALNGCIHDGIDVPAHRVVNRNGMLSGKHHFGSPTAMQEMLEAEGIKVKDDQVVDFDKHLWNPIAEYLENDG